MSGINPKEFLDELTFCLNQSDSVKAKALLQFITNPEINNVSIQTRALMELAKHPERLVFPILEYLTTLEIPNPEVQEALYELILDKAYTNHDRIIKYIIKDDLRNRKIYIKVAGDLMLSEAVPLLESLLIKSNQVQIIIEIITALGKIREPRSLTALSKRIETHSDSAVQQATFTAMANIGGKAAVDHLFETMGEDPESDLLKVKALGELQDQHALKALALLLESTDTHIRDAAIDELIKIGGKAVPVLTAATADAGTDLMIHLITTLGYIKDPKALPMILDIMKTKPADPNIRQAAFESMERIPSTQSAIALAVGIQDPVEAVRMSAARAMDRNISKVLVAGLKNIVREGNEEALNAVGALIDSDAENIFNFLLQEEAFIRLSVKHVTTKASPQTRENFLGILKRKNHQALAEKINQMVPKEKSAAKNKKDINIVVVDDSKMMLKLYENKLSGFGYTAQSFMLPEEALKAILTTKPDLIITDLNMPKINGLQLSQAIRKRYKANELPIVMITTQSDISDSSSVEATKIKKAGINKILHKPFSNEEFQATVTHFINR